MSKKMRFVLVVDSEKTIWSEKFDSQYSILYKQKHKKNHILLIGLLEDFSESIKKYPWWEFYKYDFKDTKLLNRNSKKMKIIFYKMFSEILVRNF